MVFDMPFNSYKNIGIVAKEFQISYVEESYIVETEISISDYFRAELELVLRKGVVRNSESAICENLIYPILKEIWKSYADEFLLWSHQPLNYDERLCGVPDYTLAKRSPLGKVVFDKPYCIVVEAKKDNFEEGWGQCLAALIAAQNINQVTEMMIYGIVSNGETWEFGNLKLDRFTKNIKTYSIQYLDQLFAAVNYVFDQCRLQLESITTATAAK